MTIRTGMAMQQSRRGHRRRTTLSSLSHLPRSTAVGRAIVLVVTACCCTTIRCVPLAYVAQQPRQPSILRNEDGGDGIYGNSLDDSLGRRNRLHLHREKQRREMLLSEEGGDDSSKLRDEVEEQEPGQSAVHQETSVSLHHHGVKGPRKIHKKVADKKIQNVRGDDMDIQSSTKGDANKVEGLLKEKEKEHMLVEKEPRDQDIKNDNNTPQSFGDVKEEVEQYGGMTKKETSVLKEKMQRAKSDDEEQRAIARTNGWKEKDKEKKNWWNQDEGNEGEHWPGCVCDKWESSNRKSGSKAGKSKGSKTKGSKTKGSKGKGTKGIVYHKKCIKWSCDKEIV